MNKKNGIILILFIIVLIGSGIFIYFNNYNKNNTKNYEADKTSTSSKNTNINNTTKNSVNNSKNNNNPSKNNSKKISYTETPLSEFTTKIYSKDSARQNNINITSNTLNGTIIKKGEEFSFCNTVGKATSEKGYLEADVYDRNGNKQKGLGGGNCQVSTTLYNALLKVPELVIIEKHEHSNYVPYIEKGKDAAVAYGSYDLKFKNTTNNDIKIYVQSDDNSITVKLVSIKEEMGT